MDDDNLLADIIRRIIRREDPDGMGQPYWDLGHRQMCIDGYVNLTAEEEAAVRRLENGEGPLPPKREGAKGRPDFAPPDSPRAGP